MHYSFVILFVSCFYFTPPSPFTGVRRKRKCCFFLVILFVSVVTLRHHPRLGVRRRESAFYFCNSICVSGYFTQPSPFGRQAFRNLFFFGTSIGVIYYFTPPSPFGRQA